MSWDDAAARAALRALFDAAVAAADPRVVLPRHLPPRPRGRTRVVGYGKSAALMAQVLEAIWDGPIDGVVVTRDGHAVPAGMIQVLEASHPVPDARSAEAADALLAAVAGGTKDDLVIALASGGGSALAVKPAPGLTLADKQEVNRALLASGATIAEMNIVRRHLSAFKGGRLALAAAPARVVTLAISDVPGDAAEIIASGPTVADPSSLEDARAILARYNIRASAAVTQALNDPDNETPKPGDRRLAGNSFTLIATPAMALDAAAAAARERGITPLILGDAIEGEAREVGIAMAGIARSVRRHGHPLAAPAVLLSGGETTVTIRTAKPGRGGRNTEFLAGLARGLGGEDGIWAIAGDTDGIDGADTAAGAIVAPDTLARARAAGLPVDAALAAHDAAGMFDDLDDLIVTGPTLTNVNDFRAILIT